MQRIVKSASQHLDLILHQKINKPNTWPFFLLTVNKLKIENTNPKHGVFLITYKQKSQVLLLLQPNHRRDVKTGFSVQNPVQILSSSEIDSRPPSIVF